MVPGDATVVMARLLSVCVESMRSIRICAITSRDGSGQRRIRSSCDRASDTRPPPYTECVPRAESSLERIVAVRACDSATAVCRPPEERSPDGSHRHTDHRIFKKKGTSTIEGTVIVLDEDGQVMTQPETKQPGMIELCGYGRSETKPFCDGSHKK